MRESALANTTETGNDELLKQVNRISFEISEKRTELNEIGLLEGKSGMLILFAYLSKLFPGKGHQTVVSHFLDDIKKTLVNEELGYSLSGGVAGVGFVLQHLMNRELLGHQFDLDLSELDKFVALGAERDFNSNNWDPLLGLTGLGIYFLERYKGTGERKYLEKIVDQLTRMRMKNGDRHIWATSGYKHYTKDTYNFGTAHGMPGILSFLSKVYTSGIRQEQIKDIIESCLSFLLEHEYSNDPTYCFPPAIPIDRKATDAKPWSRLGWCYGDLCMANTLIHCGRALQRFDWYEKGIEVALKTTKRTLADSGCVDAPFCHGTIGLVHQYHRLFQLTHDKVFEESRNKWINITQDSFYKKGEGAGGYYSYSYNEETDDFELKPQYGLLEGSAGIALVYLSVLYNIEPGWDIIFLTNV
jgi:lantibiotic modifying enzyme